LDDGTVFHYDRHGGWYDEYENYYDCNGDPMSNPPSDHSSLSSYDDRYAIYDGLQDDLLQEYVDYGEHNHNRDNKHKYKYKYNNN